MKRLYTLALLCFLICTCYSLLQAQTVIQGIVYIDYNGNAQMDGADRGHPVIRVHIYHDVNQNTIKDQQDTLVLTSSSNYQGRFEIALEQKPDSNYQLIAQLESKDLPTDAKLTSATKVINSLTDEIQLGFKGIAVYCYAIGDGSNPDRLMMVNRVSGYQKHLGGDLGTRYVEAMAVSPGGKSIFAVNKEKLGRIEYKSGDFKPMPDTMGTGQGAIGPFHFQDIDALAFDPFTGKLYAAERRKRARDLLCQLDTLTGKLVPNAFGEGIDYVVMEGDEGVQAEMDGLAICPITGKMYGISNYSNVTHYDLLVEIDKQTGHTSIIDTFKVGKHYLHDVEGLGFTNDGQLRATTGDNADHGYDDAIFAINMENAQATVLTNFDRSGDYESCDCLTGSVNKLSGKVFEDLNQTNKQDKEEIGLENITVLVYKDNGDGQVGTGDILIDSIYTDEKGHYTWEGAANIDLVIGLKKDDLPVGYEYTANTLQHAHFGGSIGAEEDLNNDFAVAHGSYLKEWLAFSEERQESQALWASNQLERDMVARKSAKQSLATQVPENIEFGTLGTVAGVIALAGASLEMQEKATEPATIQRMSMKDPLLMGVRFKPMDERGMLLTANAKEFVEGQLPSWINPAIATQLLKAAYGPKTIIIENAEANLKAGTYYMQIFNRSDACMKKIIIK